MKSRKRSVTATPLAATLGLPVSGTFVSFATPSGSGTAGLFRFLNSGRVRPTNHVCISVRVEFIIFGQSHDGQDHRNGDGSSDQQEFIL